MPWLKQSLLLLGTFPFQRISLDHTTTTTNNKKMWFSTPVTSRFGHVSAWSVSHHGILARSFCTMCFVTVHFGNGLFHIKKDRRKTPNPNYNYNPNGNAQCRNVWYQNAWCRNVQCPVWKRPVRKFHGVEMPRAETWWFPLSINNKWNNFKIFTSKFYKYTLKVMY